jgi:hypothetical protein
MLVVVAAVSVFVYALMPFRGQTTGNSPARSGARSTPSISATVAGSTPGSIQPAIRPAGTTMRASTHGTQPKAGQDRAAPSDAHGK